MSLFSLLNSLLLPAAFGVVIIRMLLPHRIPSLVVWMMGYGLGIGLLAQLMLILGILHIPYTFGSISAPVALIITIASWYKLRHPDSQVNTPRTEHRTPLSAVDCALMGFIIYQIIFVFWETFFIPVYKWDVIATHAFNAKILFHEQSLAFVKNFPTRAYPLQVPLLEMWVALNLGHWDDQLIKSIFFPMFLSLITFFYYFFSGTTNRRWGLIAVVFLLSSNLLINHASNGYRDLMMGYYNAAVFISLFLWHHRREHGWLVLAALFSACCSFVKLEGVGYVMMHLMGFFVLLMHHGEISFSKKLFSLIRFFIVSFGIASLYLVFKMTAFPPRAERVTACGHFELQSLLIDWSWATVSRGLVVLQYFFEDLFLSWNWSLIWFLLALSLPKILRTRYQAEAWALFISLVGFFGVHFLGFSLTQHYALVTTHLGLSRMILHFFPLGVMLLVLLNLPSRAAEDQRTSP